MYPLVKIKSDSGVILIEFSTTVIPDVGDKVTIQADRIDPQVYEIASRPHWIIDKFGNMEGELDARKV
jgi:hypothetical protein